MRCYLSFTAKNATEVARRLIDEAVGHLGSYAPVPSKGDVDSTNAHRKLSIQQIADGVVALKLRLRLTAASSGDFDLYRLIQAYLLDPEARKALNGVLKNWTLPGKTSIPGFPVVQENLALVPG